MHDSVETTQDTTQPVVASKLDENDLLRFQLMVSHLGMAKQEIENLQLKAELVQQRHEQAKVELSRFNLFLKQKYCLVEGIDQLNYANGEIKRGGGNGEGEG